ncbi:hypothetical protein [Amycolatopsis arida]|uniref:hypothetical protein n=1 Tax=Amycolatopsis arida TaxID=587909 RepID=UPI0010656A76|nr:hypothetical protein [Amycolatopsis arida]
MLVVVRTVTTLTRLLDILALLERDRRVQVVFTHAEGNRAIFAAGVPDLLRALGAPVIPWEQATKAPVDLVLAASENDDLHELPGPVLLVPHGLGYQKHYPGSRVTSGMDPDRLVHAGRVVPAAIALSHPEQAEQLRAACPPAVPRAVVVGDPCHDRMLASAHRTARYRRALGTGDRALVVLASTWGPESLLGSWPELPAALLGRLPLDSYQVAAVLHPGIWAAHGPWQVRGWLTDARRAGLVLVPPERGWQAALLAADCVVTDTGSAALYAAAVDEPVLLGARGGSTVPGSPLAALAATAPALGPGDDLRARIDEVVDGHRPGAHAEILRRAVHRPGRSAALLTELLYRWLRLTPPVAPAFPAVPEPVVEPAEVAAFVVGGRVDGDVVALERFPAAVDVHGELSYRHTVAHAELAELRELDAASVVYTEPAPTDFPRWAMEVLHRRPVVRIAAAVAGDGTCLVCPRGGEPRRLSAPGIDPLLLASFAYLRQVDPDVPAALRVGATRVEVSSAPSG